MSIFVFYPTNDVSLWKGEEDICRKVVLSVIRLNERIA